MIYVENFALTARLVGPTWEPRNCLRGPADLNSLLGVICQKPTESFVLIHPWTLMSLLSIEYSYLSSTYKIIINFIPGVFSYHRKEHVLFE